MVIGQAGVYLYNSGKVSTLWFTSLVTPTMYDMFIARRFRIVFEAP